MIHSLESIHSDTRITVFISCYNEECWIVPTVEAVSQALHQVGLSFDLVVIDDASTDQSVARVEEFMRIHPEENICLKVNRVRHGLAFNFVEAAYVGRGVHYRLVCGDNAEPIDSLVRIFSRVGDADVILPFRSSDHGRPLFRRISSRLFVALVNSITGHKIRYYNGAPVFHRAHVVRWHPHSYGFGFQADLVCRLLDEGCTYCEVETSTEEKKGGGSTALQMRNLLSVVHTVLELLIRQVRRLLYGPNHHLIKDDDDSRASPPCSSPAAPGAKRK